MMLEFAANWNESDFYPFEIVENEKLVVDWKPIIISIINDLRNNTSASIISAKFHNTLAEIILETAKKSGTKKVVLSGGCFQNALLTERTIELLQKNDCKVYWHQRVPPNDGGVSLGQIAAYLILYNNSTMIEKKNLLKKDIE